MSNDYDFCFDELVWRHDSGLIDQAMTELTSIYDDEEFERQIYLIRMARALGGIGKQNEKKETDTAQ